MGRPGRVDACLYLGHGALQCKVEHGKDVRPHHGLAALLHEDGQLVQQGHTRLYRLRPAE